LNLQGGRQVQVAMCDLMGLPIAENTPLALNLCAADAACAAAYPDLGARFQAPYSKLKGNPPQTAQGPITGPCLTMRLIGRNSFGPLNQGIIGHVPAIVAKLERGETLAFAEIVAHRLGMARTAATARGGRGPDTSARACPGGQPP
jgi:hypothetical protein